MRQGRSVWRLALGAGGILGVLAAGGCGGAEPAAEPSRGAPEPVSVTHWTPHTELFVEYPPLVARQTSRFAVHLTRLEDFTPLGAGRVTVRLLPDEGTPEVFTVEQPSRPGIFGVDVRPSRAGLVAITIEVTSGALTDAHDLGTVRVYADVREVGAAGEASEETITFLKEQQWSLEFGTGVVVERRQRPSLLVPADVVPRAGGEAQVIAPFDGRLLAGALPAVGTMVVRGQELARLLPSSPAPGDLPMLELARDEAATALDLARKERARVERLLAAGAVPARRVDEARAAEASAEARHRASLARLAHFERNRNASAETSPAGLFLLRAPLSGVVAEAEAAAGASLVAGQRLFRIVDTARVFVAGHVPEHDAGALARLAGAQVEVPGRSAPIDAVELVSIGRVVDTATRTVPVLFALDNRTARLAVGQAVVLRIFLGDGAPVPAVPESAIVDDGGRPIVFVQRGGESFVRVPVTLGDRDSGWVGLRSGPKVGERIVTRGAYLVRLAALSPQVPAHGHVH
jgi:RND family efflux transporter MFP subunit